MAVIERITLIPTFSHSTGTDEDHPSFVPGLRIAARASSSSLSDYPEWCLDRYGLNPYESIVSDGACS